MCSAILPFQDSTLLFPSWNNFTSLIGTNPQYGISASQGCDACSHGSTGQAHDLIGQLLLLGFRFLLSDTSSILFTICIKVTKENRNTESPIGVDRLGIHHTKLNPHWGLVKILVRRLEQLQRMVGNKPLFLKERMLINNELEVLLYSQEWPWTYGPPASTLGVLRSQVGTITPNFIQCRD